MLPLYLSWVLHGELTQVSGGFRRGGMNPGSVADPGFTCVGSLPNRTLSEGPPSGPSLSPSAPPLMAEVSPSRLVLSLSECRTQDPAPVHQTRSPLPRAGTDGSVAQVPPHGIVQGFDWAVCPRPSPRRTGDPCLGSMEHMVFLSSSHRLLSDGHREEASVGSVIRRNPIRSVLVPCPRAWRCYASRGADPSQMGQSTTHWVLTTWPSLNRSTMPRGPRITPSALNRPTSSDWAVKKAPAVWSSMV